MRRQPSLKYSRVIWTGGDKPLPAWIAASSEFRALRSKIFREYVRECGGLDLWKFKQADSQTTQSELEQLARVGYYGTSSIERARIFWNRATLDAWRTATSYIRNGN